MGSVCYEQVQDSEIACLAQDCDQFVTSKHKIVRLPVLQSRSCRIIFSLYGGVGRGLKFYLIVITRLLVLELCELVSCNTYLMHLLGTSSIISHHLTKGCHPTDSYRKERSVLLEISWENLEIGCVFYHVMICDPLKQL